MTTLIYSLDNQKPVGAWTTETYDSNKEAMVNACELLEAGYYVKVEAE